MLKRTGLGLLSLLISTVIYGKVDYKHAALPKEPKKILIEQNKYCCTKPRIVLTVGGGGAANSNAGASDSVFVETTVLETLITESLDYAVNKTTDSTGLFNGFLGLEWALTPILSFQIGFGYYYLGSFNVEGDLTQTINPGAVVNHLEYQYRIQSQQLLLESKILLGIRALRPYLSFGAGGASNKSVGYKIEPTSNPLVPTFDNATKSTFSYNVGIGLDYEFDNSTRLGVGYRYTDLGKSNLGDAKLNDNMVNASLGQNHLYTNEILVQLTVLI